MNRHHQNRQAEGIRDEFFWGVMVGGRLVIKVKFQNDPNSLSTVIEYLSMVNTLYHFMPHLCQNKSATGAGASTVDNILCYIKKIKGKWIVLYEIEVSTSDVIIDGMGETYIFIYPTNREGQTIMANSKYFLV